MLSRSSCPPPANYTRTADQNVTSPTSMQHSNAHLRATINSSMFKGISGVLNRLTTCKRLTDSVPKLSLITLSPLNRRDSRSAGYTGGPVNIQAVSFPEYTRKSVFQVRHGGSLKKFIMVDVGPEPTTQKTHGLSTTPFVKVLVGYKSV